MRWLFARRVAEEPALDLAEALSAAHARDRAVEQAARHAQIVYGPNDYSQFLEALAVQFRRLLEAPEDTRVPMRLNILDWPGRRVGVAHSWGNGFYWTVESWGERLAEIAISGRPQIVPWADDQLCIDVPIQRLGTISVALKAPSEAVCQGAIAILGRFAAQIAWATLGLPAVTQAAAAVLCDHAHQSEEAAV